MSGPLTGNHHASLGNKLAYFYAAECVTENAENGTTEVILLLRIMSLIPEFTERTLNPRIFMSTILTIYFGRHCWQCL